MRPFAARLARHIDRYVHLRRALGYTFEIQADTLRAFSGFVACRKEPGPLTQRLVLSFITGCRVTPNVRQRRYAVLKNFADYLAVFEPRTDRFDPQALPRSRAIPPVRLLDNGELGRLLAAARNLSPRRRIRGLTLYTMIGLLASTGLRSGEVTRLDRQDVDLDQGLVRVRRTKFRKDRLVPLHPTTRDALRTYAQARERAYPRSTSPAFFLSLRGGRWAAGFHPAFRQACAKAGLDQERLRRLRAHHLRHRFAVTRLVQWYREGANVQARLPVLATYLGHVQYSDTAYYVTGTPDLLGLAAHRAFGTQEGRDD
jgi:integrase